MKFTHLLPALGLVVAAAYGCVPEPLEGFDNGDGGMTMNNNVGGDGGGMNNTGGDMGGGGGNNFTTDFVAVTEIMKQNCLLGGCHGDPPGAASVFVVPTGMLATPGDLQAVLSSSTPTPGTGNRLIVANQPSMSEVYLRITKPAGDTQLMGAGEYGAQATPLTMTQISTIEGWISGGAQYTQ